MVITKLREAGASATEASDYLEQLEERLATRRKVQARHEGVADAGDGDPEQEDLICESTPDGLGDEEAAAFRQRREGAFEEAHQRPGDGQ